MTPGKHRTLVCAAASVFLLLAACSASTNVTRTHSDPAYADTRYSNILVIGVAGNYDNRAHFERSLASRLSSMGVEATAYYRVISGNQEISRDSVKDALRSQGFDAVLISRVLSQETDVSRQSGSSTAEATRREGSAINLFRYDYEELNDPASLEVTRTVVFSTELFDATDEKMTWAIEATISNSANAATLIDSAVDTIGTQLRNDGLIER